MNWGPPAYPHSGGPNDSDIDDVLEQLSKKAPKEKKCECGFDEHDCSNTADPQSGGLCTPCLYGCAP